MARLRFLWALPLRAGLSGEGVESCGSVAVRTGSSSHCPSVCFKFLDVVASQIVLMVVLEYDSLCA